MLDMTKADTSPVDMTTSCDEACQEQTLAASFGGEPFPFERAVFGLTPPDQAESGTWELYIEALSGGFEGCPKEDSPTPKRSLILSGLTLPNSDTPQQTSGTLFDYEGDLLSGDAPFLRASSVTLTPRAWDICTDCYNTPSPSGFLSLDVDATFEGGTVSGTLYATPCTSLDAPPAPETP